jgi:hypothetical protein
VGGDKFRPVVWGGRKGLLLLGSRSRDEGEKMPASQSSCAERLLVSWIHPIARRFRPVDARPARPTACRPGPVAHRSLRMLLAWGGGKFWHPSAAVGVARPSQNQVVCCAVQGAFITLRHGQISAAAEALDLALDSALPRLQVALQTHNGDLPQTSRQGRGPPPRLPGAVVEPIARSYEFDVAAKVGCSVTPWYLVPPLRSPTKRECFSACPTSGRTPGS